MSNQQKLIFIASLPISNLFGEKLNAWWYQENGFDVEYWDLAPIFWSPDKIEQYYGGADSYRYVGPKHRVFNDPKEVERELLAHPNCIVWYLTRFYKITLDDWVFAALQKNHIRYYLQHFDTLIEPVQFIKRLRKRLGAQRQRFLNRRLRPNGIVGSGVMGRRQSQQLFPGAHFVSIPSIKVRWQQANPIIEEPYNLFVDENIDYAPDAKMLGYSICFNPNAYYGRLNRLFDEIEMWSGKPVVIAASGKYHYQRDRFNGRRLIYGQTLPLIQNADLVVGHMSLALDQCLVSQKPMLIVDDPDFTDQKRSGYASSLVHFVSKPMLVTRVTRAAYSQILVPDIETMKRLVWEYLKEKGVSMDYHSILKEELVGNGQRASFC